THLPQTDADIVVYCASGVRSLLAAQVLRAMGYTRVAAGAGRLTRWEAGGYAGVRAPPLSGEQRARQRRLSLLSNLVERHQRKLLDAKVLLVGAGGLGSPAGLYWAAAGVGTVGIVDADVVERSNLQRQVLHTTDRVGMPKTASAALALHALNPDVQVRAYPERRTVDNVMVPFQDYDVIVDGLRIPRQSCHRFQVNPATDSAAKLPPVPRQSCH